MKDRSNDKWRGLDRVGLALGVLLLVQFFFVAKANAQGVLHTISSGQSTLTINDLGGNEYGITIALDGSSTAYQQNDPLAVEVVTADGSGIFYTQAYSGVEDLGNGSYRCTGIVNSPNGSSFSFTDVYKKYDDSGAFEVYRTVVVQNAASEDAGFSTRLAFQRPGASSMMDYDFFAPSIWYRDNAYVGDRALASSLGDNMYWFREDRMPLPVFMLRQKDNGATFSVFHKNADGSTFPGENGLDRIIDGRMKFASVGMQDNAQPLVGMLYPGTEGERTGILGMSSTKRTAYRSHPVTQGYTQEYEMAFSLTEESDYPNALKNTWQKYYTMEDPALYEVDLEAVVEDQINILDSYWKEINGAAGVPFRIKLDGSMDSHLDYNFNMGFVGHQTGNAAMLIRQGYQSNDAALLTKGEKMMEFWVNHGIMPGGIPRTWYDPYPRTWRNDYATHMRVLGDGMSGMMLAWKYEKRSGVDKPDWLDACKRVANWLSSVQNEDGSFYQQYDFNSGNVLDDSKNNTSNVIPFLVDLYLATDDEEYRQMALAAGAFIYDDTHLNYKYAGGVADNPNIMDKESASMALRAFLALYDLDKNSKWLDAAKQTAYYYQTWVFAWDVPIPQNDPDTQFPKNRQVTGLSQIATGNNAADTYAGIDAFNFYRMYLYTGDPQLLHFSKLLYQNTKQYMNWDENDPISHMAHGFLGEALTVLVPRGHGVDFFLPWQSFNILEPLILLQDVFQIDTYNVADVEALPRAVKDSLHAIYSDKRGLEPGIHPGITLSADAVKGTGTIIYPNPAKDTVYLQPGWEVTRKDPATLIVSNLSGEILIKKEVTSPDQLTFCTGALSPGVYMIELKNAANSIREKLIIE